MLLTTVLCLRPPLSSVCVDVVRKKDIAAVGRAVLKNSSFFFVKDSPSGLPLGTTNRQPPTTDH